MLKQLHIVNYALIENLNLHFEKGFTAITGETGAGKSIVMDALSLLLGERANPEVLYDKNKKCLVEAEFEISSYHLNPFFEKHDLDFEIHTILRREISQEGKSRAFINDTPVNLSILKELTSKLVDVHSQHENLQLFKKNFQLSLLDYYSGLSEDLSKYKQLFDAFVQQKNELAQLLEQDKNAGADLDYFTFQFEELNAAKLEPTEQETLETELKKLENIEVIKEKTFVCLSVLGEGENNSIEQIKTARQKLSELASFAQDYQVLSERLQSVLIELRDISSELDGISGSLVADSKRMEFIKERLDVIYSLQHKHRVKTVEELILKQDLFQEKISAFQSLEDKIFAVQKELNKKESELYSKAEKLHEVRMKNSPKLEKELVSILQRLAMKDAVVKFEVKSISELRATGKTEVNIYFSVNKGKEPSEISKIASGGELSRFMLAVKSILSKKISLPTIIFDEVDSGVSGETADKMGSLIREMSENMQVFSITHLPQVAGKGHHHFKVYKKTEKNRTQTFMKSLNREERLEEIARLLSGEKLTKEAIKNAEVLLTS